MTETTQLVGEIKLADNTTPADKSAVRNKDGEEGAVFFSKTIARWVKSNTGEDTRTTPAARDLVRQILEQEAGELCRKAFKVAQHARGASSGSRKRKVESVVRVMPKDLDLVLSIMETTPSPIEILHSKIEDDPKPKKRVKKAKVEGEAKPAENGTQPEAKPETKTEEAKPEEKKEEVKTEEVKAEAKPEEAKTE